MTTATPNDDLHADYGLKIENQAESKEPSAESSENQAEVQEPSAEPNENNEVAGTTEDEKEAQEIVTLDQKEPETVEPTGAEETMSEGSVSESKMPITVMEEAYRTVAPEWRDIATDRPETIAIKEEIRAYSLVVWYCFKDRLSEQGFLLHNKLLDGKESEIVWIKLYYVEGGRQFYIKEEKFEVIGQTIFIDKEYMLSLDEGYYEIIMSTRQSSGGTIDSSEYLYVAESDVLEEPGCWLQNSTLSYHGTEDTLQAVVENNSANIITELKDIYGTPIDPSLYTILHDGKVLEISNELLQQARGRDINLSVVGKDGSVVNVRIENYSSLVE